MSRRRSGRPGRPLRSGHAGRARAAAAAAVAASVLLGACGNGGASTSSGPGRRVDPTEIGRLLVQRQLERQPSLKVGTASCPEDVAAIQGETFDCTVEVEGQPVRVRVTIVEVVGSQIRYEMRQLQVVVDLAAVVNYIRTRLEDDWRTARVECGQGRIRILDVGMSVDCTVAQGATTRHIEAVIEDRDGTYTLREL